MDDNIYPNDGAPFMPTEPVEQKQERNKEKAKALAALPLLEDIIDRFTARIDFYDSVAAIPNEVKTDPDKFMHTVHANELTIQNLKSELDWLEGLIDDYKR